MRKRTLVLAAVLIGAGLRAAWALSAEDDMGAWSAASAADKSGLADKIMSGASVPGHVSRTELMNCLDLASSVSGHRDLPIGEVADACLHPSGPGDQARRGAAGPGALPWRPGHGGAGQPWSEARNG